MSDTVKIMNRLICISFLISVVCTILSIVLSIIDKEKLDIFNIIDIILGSLLILVLTFDIFLTNEYYMEIYGGITGILWMANNILGFFTYKNAKGKDYLAICIFLRVARILSVFSFMFGVAIKIDEM